MKTTLALNCLMLLLPFNALAHPGHETGPFAASALLLGIAALIGLGLLLAAARVYRRRKAVRADD